MVRSCCLLVLVGATLATAFGKHPAVKIATVYVDSTGGFEIFIQAALEAKHAPVRLVSDPAQADFVLDSSLFHDKEFTATTKVASTYRTSEAAFKLTSKSGEIVWAYAVTKGILSRGKQSVAEACAKHLKDFLEHQP